MQSTNTSVSSQPDICVICLYLFENMNPASQLSCGHSYHKDCLINLFNIGCKICPVCRIPYELDQKTTCKCGQININFKTLDGKTYPTLVDQNSDAALLWLIVADLSVIPSDQVRLIYQGKQLDCRDDFKISQYGIVDNCNIHVVERLRGGMTTALNGTHLQKIQSEKSNKVQLDRTLLKKYYDAKKQKIQEEVQKALQTKLQFVMKNNAK